MGVNSIRQLALAHQTSTCFLAALPPCRSWHYGQLLTPYAYLSGALCGVTEGVAFAPFQVIKVSSPRVRHQSRQAGNLQTVEYRAACSEDTNMCMPALRTGSYYGIVRVLLCTHEL
jgi:hypothetical protein